MTDNIKDLLRYVADGNIAAAKKAAHAVLIASSSKKDEHFCKSTLLRLQNEPTMIQFPSNISSFAIMEDVSETFIENRYFLTEREKSLYKAITEADKVGARLAQKRIRHLNSTLLYGESGTGKTTFGRYLAYKLGIPFLYLNFAGLISSYLGQTGGNLRRVFDFAKQQRCVFMFDELDAIGTARGRDNDTGEMSRIVISLIQSLDMLGNNIIVLAATNRYDIIDAAVKRRFTRAHEVKPLTKEERFEFARGYLFDCGYKVSPDEIDNILASANKQSDVENMLIEYIIGRELLEAET